MTADLSLEEKVSLLAGVDMWHTAAIDRAGIPAIRMTDGPNGPRGESYLTGVAHCIPCGSALGATWDPALVERVGVWLGAETRGKGAQMLLAPTVNLHRTLVGGRNFECMSEDPCLTTALAVAYVNGVQRQGVACCIKHLVANDAEHERFTLSSDVAESVLREVYLRPFEAAAAAGVWSMMGAYNLLNGTHCTEHPWLLTNLLRDEWGWDGVVVSDWFAQCGTAEAIMSGLDLEMPGPPRGRGGTLVDAVRGGAVEEKAVDRSAERVLRLIERTTTNAPDAVDPGDPAELLREAAAASIVLLRNESALPLDPGAISRLAVIGPNADRFVIQGGGSCHVDPTHVTSVVDALRTALPASAIEFAAGCRRARGTQAIDPRLLTRADGHFGLDVDPDAAAPDGSVVASATFTPRTNGRHLFGLRGNGRGTLRIDDALVVDTTANGSRKGEIELEAGRGYRLVVDAPLGTTATIRCDEPALEPAAARDRAAELAAASDVAVVVVGTDDEWETEGRDRDGIDLPGDQDELVRRVAAANPRTVVVVNAGAPVAMPWADDVAAVLYAWFPGEEGATALADILVGRRDPGGRLPLTLPRRLEDNCAFATYPGADGRLPYDEGLLIGHRWFEANDITPAYPFGHGLSYAEIEWDAPALDADGSVRVRLRNASDRAGTAVVQVYVSHPTESARPPKQLAGFQKVALGPGASCEAVVAIDSRACQLWSAEEHAWVDPSGPPQLHVGASAADIRATLP